ncbi:hypothetical protein E4U55_006736 [Claviceps digitariae]|nr:hypothetical protein E4U55_006736 [Claviceps digitariae]
MNTTDQDVFRKVGRGGAGNFYSVKKHDELSKKTIQPIRLTNLLQKDLERQDDLAHPVVVAATRDASSSLRAGRGGAGNFVDAAQVPAAQEEERNMAREVLTASLKRRSSSNKNRMGGRGGAGNWAGEEGTDGVEGERDDKQDEEAGLSRTEELERKVAEVVQEGLKVPGRVHHGREKDVKP